MKKQLGIVLVFIFIILSDVGAKAADRLPVPALGCESAILIDATTGNILYQKNADKKAYPASTTKILTAALALETESDKKMATVSAFAAKSIGIDGSNAGLKSGEKVSVNDLINMMLVISANDAANAVAETVSGSRSAFVSLMNKKVKELGLSGTHFLNPIGLDVEDGFKEHMTTAHDLAFLMRYATSMPKFRAVIGKTSYQLPKSNIHTKPRPIYQNTNLLMVEKRYHSDGYRIIGGKTGYTKAAKNVFVASARNNDGIELIAVLMKNPERRGMFDDAKELFDYGFSLVNAEPAIAAKGFYDLRGRPSEKSINALYERGILAGNGTGAFDYSAAASKEMFIKVLMEMRGTTPSSTSKYWSQPFLEGALEDGLIDETWIGKKSAPVTRGEVIRVLGKLFDLQFTDSDTLALAAFLKDYNTLDKDLKDSALEVCALGIVPYLAEGTLSPDKTLTREELMLVLCQYEGVMESNSVILFQ